MICLAIADRSQAFDAGMSAAAKQDWPAVKYAQTQLGGTSTQGTYNPGGLDLVTPSLRLAPGVLRASLNFECAPYGGYSRIDGYERFDGHTSPSTATFQIIQFGGVRTVSVPRPFGVGPYGTGPYGTGLGTTTGASGGDFASMDFSLDFFVPTLAVIPTVGAVVVQDVTGATGTVVAVVSTPVPYIAVTMVTGTFDTVNAVFLSPHPPGGFVGYPTPLTITLDLKTIAILTAAAADIYRALILKPPGSGPIQGVVGMIFLNLDQVFAFRADAGNTQTLLWRATTAGWVQVPFGNLVSFTAGAGGSLPDDGTTLTQGGVTAVINRVMWQSGAWAGSAVGQMVISTPIGGSFAAGAATATGGATMTLSGVQAPIVLQPGGRFEFTKGNFAGQAITRRVYGCDGVNPAFEFDGVTLAPIKTGLSPDQPLHITFHKNFLFVAQGSSIIHCAAGLPFMWDSVDGGGEIATGDVVRGMLTLPGSQTTSTLAVALRTNSAFLYGTDPTTFNFVSFSTGIGAVQYSLQNLFDTFFLDDFGVVSLKTTLNWGNFLPTSLTKNILPFIEKQRGHLTASSVNREKSQYRLYFSDASALFVSTLNGQYIGSTVIQYDAVINCVDTMNKVSDVEATYAGGTDGYVYELDVGTSFDGQEINAYFTTAWDFLRSPRILKRFRAASVEFQGAGYTEVQFGYQLSYDNAQMTQIPPVTAVLNLTNIPRWDSFTWDNFVWDGSTLLPTDLDMTGTAENIRFQISSATNYIAAYTTNSIMYHYSMRRGLRV